MIIIAHVIRAVFLENDVIPAVLIKLFCVQPTINKLSNFTVIYSNFISVHPIVVIKLIKSLLEDILIHLIVHRFIVNKIIVVENFINQIYLIVHPNLVNEPVKANYS